MGETRAITALVATYMSRYDHNRNGKLEMRRPEGLLANLLTRDERLRSRTTVTPAYDEDRVNLSTAYHTIDRLLYAADKNQDGVVTPGELTAAIAAYDADGDGALRYRGFLDTLRFRPRDEGDRFERDLGERLRSITSVDF